MGNKVILILGLWVFVLGSGCVALEPPAGYQEEALATVNTEEPDIIETPPNLEMFDLETSPLESSPLVEVCDCRFAVSEENGLVCLRVICSEGCPEETRQCASTIGGCTIRR